mmetsp:Transcript_12700/g.18673  ORF Transcript_12700/g.18673 Transcript_12700/m.18673 type:complete len:353 (-) Transcript_12700:101-1159(-)
MNYDNMEDLAHHIVETRVKRKSVLVLGQAIQTVLAILVLFYEKIVECSNSNTLTTSLENQLQVISENNITDFDFTETLSNVGSEFLDEQGEVFKGLNWQMLDTCFKTSVIRDSELLDNVSPTENPAYGAFILFGIISASLAGLIVYCQGCTAQNDNETSVSLENLYLRTSKFPFVDTLLELPISIRYAPCTTSIVWLGLLVMIVLGGITFFVEGSNVILAVLLVVLSYLQLVGAICEYRVLTVYKEEDENDFPIQEEKRSRSRSRPRTPRYDSDNDSDETPRKEKRSKSRSRRKEARERNVEKKRSKSRSKRKKDQSTQDNDQHNFSMEQEESRFRRPPQTYFQQDDGDQSC